MSASHWSFLLGYILKIFFICRFCVGDLFYLYENKILCGPDYEERMVFANLSANPAQLAILKELGIMEANGTISPEIMPDGLHPNAKGYEIWANAIDAKVTELMKKTVPATKSG